MTEAMEAEFDTVADWTAEAVNALGPDHAIPAAYRGSGGPLALDWLIEELPLRPGDGLLDAGAGMGGPAAYAAEANGVRPLLIEPMPGACRAARELFRLPVVTGDGRRLPVRTAAIGAAWSLGVLCTLEDKRAALAELRRVLQPGGRLGLLVYLQTGVDLPFAPEGNTFPTAAELTTLLDQTGFAQRAQAELADLGPTPETWRRRGEEVDEFIAARHRTDQRWLLATRQSEQLGALLAGGHVAGRLITATALAEGP